jgi:uncharacterized membrane protein (DUF106 family)
MGYLDAWIIIAVSLLSGLAAELVSWLLIYRTPGYVKLKRQIDALTSKVDRKKEAISGTVNTARKTEKEKKVAGMDSRLKSETAAMSGYTMKATIVVTFIMMSTYFLLNHFYDGRVVALLPFEPIPLLTGMTHRGLPGKDFTECNMIFVYTLCSFSLRGAVTRFFGFQPEQDKADGAGGMFAPPPGADRGY